MTIKNIVHLRDHLIESLERLDSGQETYESVTATSKLSREILRSAALQMTYARMRGKEPKVEFMNTEEDK